MKILIIKTSSLGDVIHSLPALSDIKNNVAEISCDFVVEEAFAEIPSWHPVISNVIPVAWRRMRRNLIKAIFSGELFRFIKRLRKQKYDLIIDAQGLIKSALLAKIARGKICGFAKHSARESVATWFYKRKIAVAKNQHAITRLRQLFAVALNYAVPTNAIDYGINLKLFPHVSECENYLVFFHGTSRADKLWAESKWIELTKIATDAGFIVYLPWGNVAELNRAQRIAENCKNTKVLPKLDLLAIAALLREAKGVVAVDTGLGHLAAVFNLPIISLYGPTNPDLIGTVGEKSVHLNNFNEVTAEDVWRELRKWTLKD